MLKKCKRKRENFSKDYSSTFLRLQVKVEKLKLFCCNHEITYNISTNSTLLMTPLNALSCSAVSFSCTHVFHLVREAH